MSETKDEAIDRVIAELISSLPRADRRGGGEEGRVEIGVSNRHVHLSRQDLDTLFGPGAELHRKKAMKQPGQFAAEETIELVGPKGRIGRVRVLGPVRGQTQIEISVADGFRLGIKPPLRLSGELDATPGVELVGSAGRVVKEQGVIVAKRHIHLPPATARRLGLVNGQEVAVEVPGERGALLHHVAIRASAESAAEMHIDVEEANAVGLRNGDFVRIVGGR